MTRKVLVINPVANAVWDEADYEYFRRVAAKDTQIELISIDKGPISIESARDENYAAPAILKIVKDRKDKVDGILINCFADPALHAAREICDIPVVGPGESSISLALLLGEKFSIVSVKKNVVSMFEMKVRALGLSQRLASVDYIDISVVELEDDKNKTATHLVRAIEKAVSENSAEVAIFGCTGMVSTYQEVVNKVNVPVIEPAATALKTVEKLIDLGLRTSKIGLYGYPELGKIKGY